MDQQPDRPGHPRGGLQHLRPGNEYDNLYLSAQKPAAKPTGSSVSTPRKRLPWLPGGASGRSDGCRPPTLAIICSRYLENKAFKPATYFRLKLSTAKEGTEFTVLSTEKFDGRRRRKQPAPRLSAPERYAS